MRRESEPDVSRRDSVRLAAAMVVSVAVGMPALTEDAESETPRLQLRFYRAASDGGQLVGTIDLTEQITAFIGSAAGTRAQVKWYDWGGKEVGTMGVPSFIQERVMASLKALPPEQ